MNVTAVCFRPLRRDVHAAFWPNRRRGLCAADKGLIFQRDGDVLRLVANLGYSR
jgi:hypothetical protein